MTFDETSLEPLVSFVVPHSCHVMTSRIPILRKLLFYPIYIVNTNFKVHVRVFQKTIQANGEKHNLNIVNSHYYILCLFAKGQTKNLKVLRKKNKKREGFAKEKKLAKFAIPSASQLVAQQSSQIYNEPLIIAALLRDSRQTKLCDPLNACPS